jgi:hypothetical protein
MPELANTLNDRILVRHELELARARRDPAAFAAYVLDVRLADFQRRWFDTIQSNPRVVLLAPIEHGKTSLISIALPLFVLGTNPNARIAIISETATQATRILGAIREHILGNPRVREVFPRLRPARGIREQWSDSSIVVDRSITSKDASVIALGELGPLTGTRLDLAILDDVLSWTSTCTETLREKTIAWFKNTLIGRIVHDGKIVAAGSAWHEEDLLHVLAQSSEYFAIRDPAMDPRRDVRASRLALRPPRTLAPSIRA